MSVNRVVVEEGDEVEWTLLNAVVADIVGLGVIGKWVPGELEYCGGCC